jgi:hypothetical protein
MISLIKCVQNTLKVYKSLKCNLSKNKIKIFNKINNYKQMNINSSNKIVIKILIQIKMIIFYNSNKI